MSDRLLTAEGVAEFLAVPESWVREATREGRIPYVALGRYRRYERAAINAWGVVATTTHGNTLRLLRRFRSSPISVALPAAEELPQFDRNARSPGAG